MINQINFYNLVLWENLDAIAPSFHNPTELNCIEDIGADYVNKMNNIGAFQNEEEETIPQN